MADIIMSIIVCTLFVCLVLLLLLAIFGEFIEEHSHLLFLLKNKKMARLPFNKFKAYRELNPHSWSLGTHHALKHDNGNCYHVTFSLGDYVKYKRFVKRLSREKRKGEVQKARDDATVGVLKAVQKDIDMVRRRSDREIASAKENILNCIEIIR